MANSPLGILLIEDNPDHSELIMRNFQDHKVPNKIYHLPDGEAALNYLFRREEYSDPKKSPRPQVILSDLRLPKIDGLEVLKEIKTDKILREIPVVVLTTSAAEEDMKRAYEHHTNSYVVKPVNFEKFNQLMGDLEIYWLNWNRKPLH